MFYDIFPPILCHEHSCDSKGTCRKLYENAPNNKYFPYAIESSFIYCMPEVGSQVHIYFPGADESGAVAVHAIRMTAKESGGSDRGYAQIPDNKSFSNVNGAELLFMQGGIDLYSDTDKASCIMMDTQGNAAVTGRDIEMKTQGNLSIGEPDSEGGEPAGQIALVSDSITFRIGEDGSEINLTEEAHICAVFVKLEASDRTPASNPSAKEVSDQVTAGDKEARDSINDNASAKLVEKYETGRSQILHGFTKIAATVGAVAVYCTITVVTGGVGALAAPAVLGAVGIGAGVTAVAMSDIGEGVDSVKKSQTGDLNKAHNFIRDDILKNDLAYDVLKVGLDIAFGVVTGRALNGLQGLKGVLKTGMQVGGNVATGIL